MTLCPALFISDIDECDDNLDNCAEDNAECANTIGSFTCTCDPGYSGDGTMCTGECLWDIYNVMCVGSRNGSGTKINGLV